MMLTEVEFKNEEDDSIPHKVWLVMYHDDMVGFKETLVIAYSEYEYIADIYCKGCLRQWAKKNIRCYLRWKE